jgi:hypothetical protein
VATGICHVLVAIHDLEAEQIVEDGGQSLERELLSLALHVGDSLLPRLSILLFFGPDLGVEHLEVGALFVNTSNVRCNQNHSLHVAVVRLTTL